MTSADIRIDSFLRLGYFIDYTKERAPIDFSGINNALYVDVPYDELIREGVKNLRRTISALLVEGRDHVLPLSGGLDSRLILGALLEHLEPQNLQTFTYGVEGSYDYEIGNSIARDFGTRHTPICLSEEAWQLEEELDVARRTDFQGVLFHHPPLAKLDRLYDGALFWSGYVGDAVAGSHLHEPPSATLEDAKLTHLRHRTLVKSTRLHRSPDRDFLAHMDGGGLNPEVLTWDEQVLFSEACAKFTAPLVLFREIDFVTPFINTPWMDFMLSVPNRFRLGQQLMIDIGRSAYPELFDSPSKNRLGHNFRTPDAIVRATFWLNRARKLAHQFIPRVNYPPIQYADFNESIRSNPHLRRIVRDSTEDLRVRGICDWVDFDGLWRKHDRRIRNHGDALIVLASLELISRAHEDDSAA
jgi:hypothetical protein